MTSFRKACKIEEKEETFEFRYQKKEIRKLTKALESKTKALEEERREVERLHAVLEDMEIKKM